MSSIVPPVSDDIYDESIRGVFGNFGAGMGIRVCFIQSAIDVDRLDKIQLVHEIPGSDRWPVRDLFQREVDSKRVESSILPWLQDSSKVKFFNPLTLTLIPVDPRSNQIESEITVLNEGEFVDSAGVKWFVLERPSLYRFRYMKSADNVHKEYGMVEWNSRRVRVVAIDGQHRLSALKRYMVDHEGPGFENFTSWNVPVVVSGLHSESKGNASILDVVRSMFVYINTQAKSPSKTRQILLNDENINYVCVQELLQYSHENDVIDDNSIRDSGRVPLLFYDWRGETRNGRDVPTPASLKSIAEVFEWFDNYLLMENFSPAQMSALGIIEEDQLAIVYSEKAMTSSHVPIIREQFREWVLPGVAYLLENFSPYEQYIDDVMDSEQRWLEKSDVFRHAFSVLRFGNHRGGSLQDGEITAAHREIVQELITCKSKIPMLLLLDIGMRGIVQSFGILKDWYDEWTDENNDWLSYSRWFTTHLNQMFEDDWFGKNGNSHRLHVTRNAADNIVNHKIGDAHRALGPFVSLVVCRNAFNNRDIVQSEEQWEEVWSSFEDVLRHTVTSGYKKQHVAEFRTNEVNWSLEQIKSEAESKANKSAHAQMRRLKKAICE